MIGVSVGNLLAGLLNLALLAGAALYAGLVVMNYRADSVPARPELDLRDPARSAERVAVWVGVKTLQVAVRMGTPVFGMLSEASADVGDWFLRHRDHQAH